MDRAKLASLLAVIRGREPDERLGRVVCTLEEFFDGNDDLASIGCNLGDDRPSVADFMTGLLRVRARPDVDHVMVGIAEDMGDAEWPFTDAIFVVTTASAATIAADVEALQATSVESMDGLPPALMIWWD